MFGLVSVKLDFLLEAPQPESRAVSRHDEWLRMTDEASVGCEANK